MGTPASGFALCWPEATADHVRTNRLRASAQRSCAPGLHKRPCSNGLHTAQAACTLSHLPPTSRPTAQWAHDFSRTNEADKLLYCSVRPTVRVMIP